MKPSDYRFMVSYMKSAPCSDKASSDNFDIDKRQAPFKVFKAHDKADEYSVKKQKNALYRILSKEQIDDSDVLERINETNQFHGYNKEIV